jgi:NADH-quinone oxidoreductase subunit N
MREFFLIMPEIFLALTLALIIAGEITYFGEQVRLITATSLVGLCAALVQTMISYQYGASQIFGGALSIDGFSLFFKMLFITLAILTILSISDSKEIASNRRSEFCALIVAATLAMCFVASAADLIFIFLSLIFMNTVCYFLAAYGWRSLLSTEAAVKYLAFGAVSATLLLYSLAILFAYSHSLNIYEIHQSFIHTPLPFSAMLVAFILSFLAFSFQIGAFPMYLCVPDILEGSPTPVSAFLSIGARAAGFAVATRFLIIIFSQPGSTPGQWQVMGPLDWVEIVSLISGVTMMIGSLLSFQQKGAKRLVGYLVVAETGFLLMGILVLDEMGIAALLYNLVIELFALMGIFYILSFIFDELKSDRLEKMRGLLKRAVPECICLVIFLLCLVGSPPLPGFIGKFTLIGVAIRHERLILALAAVASIVISSVGVIRMAYYWLGDFAESEKSEIQCFAPSYSRKVFLSVMMFPMILVVIFADLVFKWAGQSLAFIFW